MKIPPLHCDSVPHLETFLRVTRTCSFVAIEYCNSQYFCWPIDSAGYGVDGFDLVN